MHAFVCLAVLVVAWAGAAGCSKAPPEPTGLDVRIGFGLSSGPQRDNALRVLTSYLYTDPLVAQEWDGRIGPRLAESWAWEDDGCTLRVRIREAVVFHDGTLLTAGAIVGSLEAYRSSHAKQPGYVGGFRRVESIAADGDLEVVIRLSAPDSFLVSELAEITIQAPHDQEVGTGPFKLISRQPIRTERHEQYYLGRPAIQGISVIPFDSQRSAWAALLRGEIDVVQEIHRDAVEFMEGSTQVKTYSSLRPYYIPLVFNFRHPILRDPDVRRALNAAVDRNEIVRNALRGYAQAADDPIWPAHWAYTSAGRQQPHNPEAARLRLDRAGFPVRSAGPDRMARRFTLTCLFWNEDPQFERIALLLQRQLAQVGVDLELTGLALNDLVGLAGTGRFDTLLLPVRSGRTLDVTYEFWRSAETAAAIRLNSGYTGADRILDHLRTVRSDGEIRTAVADLQQRFSEDVPAVFIAWQETTRAVDARIDVSDRAEPDILGNIWRWRPAAPQQAGR